MASAKELLDSIAEAGIENEHSDGYHDEAPEPQCVQCFPHG
jgi:hypothetical protein